MHGSEKHQNQGSDSLRRKGSGAGRGTQGASKESVRFSFLSWKAGAGNTGLMISASVLFPDA